MKLTKSEQLRKVFKKIITNYVCWRDINGLIHNEGCLDESDIKVILDKLLYEVKIRTNLSQSAKSRVNTKIFIDASEGLKKTIEHTRRLNLGR